MDEEIERTKALRQRVIDLETDEAVGPILKKFRDQIDETKEILVNAEKKDFDKLQARIYACRQIAVILKGAYEHELADKIEQRAEFYKANELILAASEPKKGKKDKAEVASAAS